MTLGTLCVGRIGHVEAMLTDHHDALLHRIIGVGQSDLRLEMTALALGSVVENRYHTQNGRNRDFARGFDSYPVI